MMAFTAGSAREGFFVLFEGSQLRTLGLFARDFDGRKAAIATTFSAPLNSAVPSFKSWDIRGLLGFDGHLPVRWTSTLERTGPSFSIQHQRVPAADSDRAQAQLQKLAFRLSVANEGGLVHAAKGCGLVKADDGVEPTFVGGVDDGAGGGGARAALAHATLLGPAFCRLQTGSFAGA